MTTMTGARALKPASTLPDVADLANRWGVTDQERQAAAGGLGELTACTTCRRPMFAVTSRCGFCFFDVRSEARG